MSWEVRTMRSGTSFFNGTLYRKAFFRFWPIWAIYGAQWLLLIPLPFLATALRRDGYGLSDLVYIPDSLVFGAASALVAGVVCAMAVFSYLYSSRSACMMHALPVRREALFCSNYLAGLSFLLLPHLAVYIFTIAVEASLNCLDLGGLTAWLLCQSGMCLFFYSFAVFCAMFTGNLVALPLFYGILNFLVYLMVNLVEQVCRMFLCGFNRFPSPVWQAAAWLTPWLRLSDAVQYGYFNGSDTRGMRDPSAVAVYAAAGVVFALAALLVYRVRHIETAGDVVSVKVVRPVFKYGFAFCTGLTGGLATCGILYQDSGLALTVWVVFWGIVGYFAAEMLLKKSFRVLKAWKGGAALGAVLLLLCLSVNLDWYGFESRVPAAGQVESVDIYGLDSAPYDGAHGSLTLTDPEDIQLVTQLHQMAIQAEPETDASANAAGADSYLYLYLTYHLADGTTLRRDYDSLPLYEEDLNTEGTLTALANQFLSDQDNVAQMYGFEEMEEGRLVEAYLVSVWNTGTQAYEDVYIDGSAQELWDAMKQDFEEDTIGVRYLLENSQARLDNTCVTDLCFSVEVPLPPEPGDREASQTDTVVFTITLTPNASHTLALLRELGALDETHIAPTYGEYLSDTETTYDGYRNPDGSIPEDILYDAPNTRTVS